MFCVYAIGYNQNLVAVTRVRFKNIVRRRKYRYLLLFVVTADFTQLQTKVISEYIYIYIYIYKLTNHLCLYIYIYIYIYIYTGFEINACPFAGGEHKFFRTIKFSV